MKNDLQSIFGAGLRSRVAVYVPGTSGPADPDSALSERMTAEAAARLSELFGGATISLAAGAWMSAEHGLIRENVQIVYSFCTSEQLEQNAEAVRALAVEIKREMQQEAVSVEIDGALYFI